VSRRLLLAVAASVAAHGAILVAAAWLPAPAAPGAEETIAFEVVETEPEPVVEPAPEPEPAPVMPASRIAARPAPAPPAPDAARAPESPEPPGAPAPEPPPDEPLSGALAAADALPADAAGGIPVAVSSHAVAGALTGGAGRGGGGAGVGTGSSAGIGPGGGGGNAHGALLARLRSRTAGCYPRAAVRRRVEGVARVSFCVAPDGTPDSLRLVAGSGSHLLDGAALDCVVRGAAPLPDPGACVVVPIDFHLRR
jgi:TonB family protein